VASEASPSRSQEPSTPSAAAPTSPTQTSPAVSFSALELSALLTSPPPELSRLGADVSTPIAPVPMQAAPESSRSAVRISTAALERHELGTGPGTEMFRVAGVEIGDALNVRSGPSEFHEALGTIPYEGRGVHIVGECEASWCPVRYGDLSGWVNASYLAEDE
jgi:Bacterial SH3 domain